MQTYRKNHPDKKITIEGAISYVSEPEEKQRAWTLDEYAAYAVELAKLGCDEIAIKNYAGVGDKEMPALISTIHKKLAENGFSDMHVNLHDHGAKPEVLMAALEAGADKVDVAIGALSDGPAHTNMRTMIYALLEKQGFKNSTEIDNHPMMKQLAKIEVMTYDAVNKTRDIGTQKGTSFYEQREPLKKITQDDADHYRVAAGALSDLSGRLNTEYVKNPDSFVRTYGADVDKVFARTLEKAAQLWEKAGRFNTVTPGAKILIDQALKLIMNEALKKPESMDLYIEDFKNAVTGRFGKNQGMEKGIGDVKFRDAILMYNALKKISEQKDSTALMQFLCFAKLGGKDFHMTLSHGELNLKDPGLENILKNSNIETFKNALDKAGLSPDIKKELNAERSPTPIEGLEVGRKIVADTPIGNTDSARLSNSEDLSLLAMMLRNGNDNTFRAMVAHNAPPHSAIAQGTIATIPETPRATVA